MNAIALLRRRRRRREEEEEEEEEEKKRRIPKKEMPMLLSCDGSCLSASLFVGPHLFETDPRYTLFAPHTHTHTHTPQQSD
jgi:hypothetical protein